MGNSGTKLNQKWIENRQYDVIKERDDPIYGKCTIIRFNQLTKTNSFYVLKTINPKSYESLEFSNEEL